MRFKTNQDLIEAIDANDLEKIQSLLKGNLIVAKVDPNVKDEKGKSALEHVMLIAKTIKEEDEAKERAKLYEGVRNFIKANPVRQKLLSEQPLSLFQSPTNSKLSYLKTNNPISIPYDIKIKPRIYNTKKNIYPIINILLDNGAKIDTKDNFLYKSYLDTLMYCAEKKEDVITLLRLGVDINTPDNNRNTALHYAVRKNDTNIIEFLLAQGADPNIFDREGSTALNYSIEPNYSYLNTIKLLLKHGANPNIGIKNGLSVLHRLIEKDSDEIQLLLNHGADPNLRDHNGNNALFYIIKHDVPPSDKLLWERIYEIEKQKPGSPSYPNTKYYFKPPTQEELDKMMSDASRAIKIIDTKLAERKNEYNTKFFKHIQWLLEKNIDINARNNYGLTALHLAAQLNVDIGIIRLLVTNGANINLPDSQGQTPIFYTITENDFHKEIAEYFLNYENQSKAESLYSLKQGSSNYNHSFNKTLHVKDAAGKSLLHKAIELENERVIYSLIDEYGIDPFAKDDQKKSPEDYIKEKILNYVKEQDQSYEKQKSTAFNDKINTYKKLLNHIQTNCRRSYPNQIKYPVPSPSPSEQKRPVAAPGSIIATVNTTSTTSQKATEVTKDNKVTSPQVVTQTPSKSTTPPVTASTPTTPAPKEPVLKIDEKVLSEIKPKIDQLIQEQLVAQSAVLFKSFSSSLKQIQEKYRVDANQMNVANSNLSAELQEKIQGEMLAEFTKIVIPQMQSDLQRLMQDQVYLDQVQKMQECFMNAIHKRHTSLTSEVTVLSNKIDPLHKEYTAKEAVKAQQRALLEQPVIVAFYKELEIQLSSRFSCQMLLISKVFQETKSNVQKGGELAVDIFTKFLETIPGFSLITFLANFALKEGVIRLANDIKEKKHAHVMNHFQLTEDAPIQAEAIARAIAIQYQERGALTHANTQQATLAGRRAAEKLYEYIAQGYLSPLLSETEKLQELQQVVAPDKILKGILPPEQHQHLRSRQQNYKLAVESQKQQQIIGLQQKNTLLEKEVTTLNADKRSLEQKVESMGQDLLALKIQFASLFEAHKAPLPATPPVIGEWTLGETKRSANQPSAAPEK